MHNWVQHTGLNDDFSWFWTSDEAVAIMSLLLRHGARPDIADDFGETPLDLAVGERFALGVELLFQYEAGEDCTESRSKSLIFAAVKMDKDNWYV